MKSVGSLSTAPICGFDPDAAGLAAFDKAVLRAAQQQVPQRPLTILSEGGGYYSAISEYAGRTLSDLRVTGNHAVPVTGTAVAYSWRTSGSLELLLSSSAATGTGTGTVGPDLGWTEDGRRLVFNAVSWARDTTTGKLTSPTLRTGDVVTRHLVGN